MQKKEVQTKKGILNFDMGFDEPDIKMHIPFENGFSLYGLKVDDNGYYRLPSAVAENCNPGVAEHARSTAGGRVRFKTDSAYVAIRCVYPSVTVMPNMTMAGTSGFDLYVDGEFHNVFMPPWDIMSKKGYDSITYLGDRKMRNIIIDFPLYNPVGELQIGLQEDADICPADSYKNEKPVVFYGSSITQGASASHPGNSYQNIISRELGIDYINLGFSGSARAEKAMSEYINSLDMSAFVYDYDHNAPNAEYLAETHERFYKEIREKNPDLPVVFVTKPDYDADPEGEKRRQIIMATYNAALSRGEKVYFVDGSKLWFEPKLCSADRVHPNDMGLYGMAKGIAEPLKEIFK